MYRNAISSCQAGLLALTFGATTLGSAAPVTVNEFVDGSSPETYAHFLTASPEEAATITWTQTWLAFKAEDSPGPGLVPVCRFYTPNYGYPTHVFTAFPDECQALRENPVWIYEGTAFYARLPSADGSCSAGTIPFYRLFGEPAYRSPPVRAYTPFPGARSAHLQWGHHSEGFGENGVAFCVPAAVAETRLRTESLAGSQWDISLDSTGQAKWRAQFGTEIEEDRDATRLLFPSIELAMPARLNARFESLENAIWPWQTGLGGWDPISERFTLFWPGAPEWFMDSYQTRLLIMQLEIVDAHTLRGCSRLGRSTSGGGLGGAVAVQVLPEKCVPVTARRISP